MCRLRLIVAILGLFLPFVMGSQTFGTTELQAWETNFLLPPPSPVSPDFPRHWLVPTPDWQDIGGEWEPMGLDEVIP